MPKSARERSAALLRTLPGPVILQAAGLCTGHNILKPEAIIVAGIPESVVTCLTRTFSSGESPKESLFVDGRRIEPLEGIWGLDALRFFAGAFDVAYAEAFGRGTEAARIRAALHLHFEAAATPPAKPIGVLHRVIEVSKSAF
jgi:hypothetical protein